MNGKLFIITKEKLNKLKGTIPEAFTESKIYWEKLKAVDITFKAVSL